MCSIKCLYSQVLHYGFVKPVAYTSWSTLVQVKAWQLFNSKPFAKTLLTYGHLDPWVLNGIWINSQTFSLENTFENVVCKMSTYLFRPEYADIQVYNAILPIYSSSSIAGLLAIWAYMNNICPHLKSTRLFVSFITNQCLQWLARLQWHLWG